MKHFGRNPIVSFGSLLLAAAWLFSAAAQAATPGAAQVKKVVGTASYTDARGGGPIKEGDILMAGATITTGAASYVDLDMGVNGNALRVEADSTLSLNKLDYTKAGEMVVNTELEVKKGAAVANVINKLSKASKYEIKTPAGVAGIRGTVLRAGTTRIVCLIGRISFVPTAGGGVQIVISGGAGYQAGAAGAVRATSVETTGLARTACSLTANTLANMVSQAVQQFTAAIAAEAATEAGRTGGNAAQEAAQVAQTVLAQLVQEVQAAVATAPPAMQAAVQAAATSLANNTAAVGATAAVSAAVAATVANGGTAAEARTAAQAAATASTANVQVATAAANSVTTAVINQAVQAQINNQAAPTPNSPPPVSVVELVVNNTQAAPGALPPPPPPGPLPGPKTGVETKVGETQIFVSPTTK